MQAILLYQCGAAESYSIILLANNQFHWGEGGTFRKTSRSDSLTISSALLD